MKLWVLVILLIGLLTACGSGDDGPIPTLANLPSPTFTSEPTREIQGGFVDVSPSPSFTPTVTDTPSHTPTQPPTLSPTVTVTPSATITDTPTATSTALPTVAPENRPLLSLALTALAATVLPEDFVVPPHIGAEVVLQPTPLPPGVPSPIPPLEAATVPSNGVTSPACQNQPPGGFGAVFTNNPALASQLGCPVSVTEERVPAAWQGFQQGTMVWLNGEVLVFYGAGGQFQSFADTYVDGADPQTSSETPPDGFYAPVRGFLKVWSSNPDVRNNLGWALHPEQGVTAVVLRFQNGRMIWLPGRGDIFVLLSTSATGTWQSVDGIF